ncbi:MAG: double zinc ribbon domain-containing protein [Candidatus Dormiibacterota bacterium]
MRGEAIVDFFFPPRCGGCRAAGGWFCAACRASLRPARLNVCLRCGRRTSITPCPLCDEAPPALDELFAPLRLEGPLREAVHRLKYGDRPRLAVALATLWRDWRPPDPAAVLVPVPLGRRRRRQRGYNQAEELARHLAVDAGLGCLAGAMVRELETGSQVGRGGDDRRQALQGAFAWRGGDTPSVVVLVDDVVTTGATLMECGRACRDAGAARVYGLALAIG